MYFNLLLFVLADAEKLYKLQDAVERLRQISLVGNFHDGKYTVKFFHFQSLLNPSCFLDFNPLLSALDRSQNLASDIFASLNCDRDISQYDFKQPKNWLVCPEVFVDKKRKKDCRRFLKNIMDMHDRECECCRRLDTSKVIRWRKLNLDKFKDVNNIVSAIAHRRVPETGIFEIYVCDLCWTSLSKNIFPPMAYSNGFTIPESEPILDELNPFELLLISPFRICQRIVRLTPKSVGYQFGVKGISIAFHNERTQLVDRLPDVSVLIFEDEETFTRIGKTVLEIMFLLFCHVIFF